MSLIFICFLLKVLFPLNVELKLNFSIFLLEVNMYNIILEDGGYGSNLQNNKYVKMSDYIIGIPRTSAIIS